LILATQHNYPVFCHASLQIPLPGAATIIRQVASSCSILKQLPAPAAATSSSASTAASRRQQLQLLSVMQRLQGLISDVWAALKALGGAVGKVQGAAAAAVTPAAAAAAEAGHALLQGLCAVGEGVVAQQQGADQGGDVEQELQQQTESECGGRGGC
jgi:hypothetical protein